MQNSCWHEGTHCECHCPVNAFATFVHLLSGCSPTRISLLLQPDNKVACDLQLLIHREVSGEQHGLGLGPLISVVLFAVLGNTWEVIVPAQCSASVSMLTSAYESRHIPQALVLSVLQC